MFKVCNSDTFSLKFLLPEKLVGSSFSYIVLSFLFQFCQFLFNFLKYLFLNFPLSHLYNIFAIYFPGSFSLLKFFSSIQSILFCLLTSVFTLFSNFFTNSFTFSKSSSFSQLSCSTINPFYYTKYFTNPLTFLLFKSLSTSYSLTPFISTSSTSTFFCLST